MAIYQQMRSCAKLIYILLILSHCAAVSAAEFNDWIVTETCSQYTNKLCHGYYKQYSFPNTSASSQSSVNITSDEASFVAKGTSEFIGNVKAVQGDKVIFADKAKVERDKNGDLEKITLYGKVQIMQPGVRVDGSKAIAYIGQEKKVVNNAVYRLYDRHARGTAEHLTIKGDDLLTLCDATYTTCAPDSNTWYLQANSTEFDKQSGRGEAWHAKLYLKDFPVFYWPYVNFPIDDRRKTGFLQPSYASSSWNGRTFIAPFYWNIAPNFDAFIRTNYMSKRGWKFDSKFRYLTSHSDGDINFDFLPHDRGYRALRERKFSDPLFALATDSATALRRNDLEPRDFRYRFALRNHSRFNKNFLFDINYNTASDGNYFYDFNDRQWGYVNDQFSTIYALQMAAITYRNCLGDAKLSFEQFKTFHVTDGPSGDQQLAKLPQLSITSNDFSNRYGMHAAVAGNYTKFKPKIVPDNDVALSYGERVFARPELYYLTREPGWFLKPRVQLNYVRYTALNITAQDRGKGMLAGNSSTSIPMYDLKGGLTFEKQYSKGLLQTLEPQLYYLYVPQRNQNALPVFDSGAMTFDYAQVFRDNRYSGYDRVSEANQLGMGIASKFYSGCGNEIAMVGIGQIYYFRNILLQLDNETDYTYRNWSPFAAVAKVHVGPKFDLIANWVRHRNVSNTASLQIQYKHAERQVINFGYEMAHNPEPDDLTGRFNSDVQQVNVSTAWQLTTPLRLIGRYNYDLRFQRTLDVLAGFQYDTCCTALRFLWGSAWDASTIGMRQHRNTFHIQFIFKGFSGVGNAEDSFLESMIPGYKT